MPQAPSDNGKPGFILNSDSVVFFKQKDPDYIDGQHLLAHLIMTKEFQTHLQPGEGLHPGAARRGHQQRLQPVPADVARKT